LATPHQCDEPGAADGESDVYDDIVNIVVGPTGATKQYKTHRGLLCYHSDYFARLLNGAFKEAGSDTLRLADVRVRTFETFFYWLYAGVMKYDQDKAIPPWYKGVEAYVFADYHQMRLFKNAILDCMYLGIESGGSDLGGAKLIYENTTTKDPLRRLLLDLSIQVCEIDCWRKGGDQQLNMEFLIDYIFTLRDKNMVPGAIVLTFPAFWAEMRSHFCERYHDHTKVEGLQIMSIS
jgi:hypothetical protein